MAWILALAGPARTGARASENPIRLRFFRWNAVTAESLTLDAKAWKLLLALQQDGRAPLKTLAAAAGLSVPATVERLKRLQDAGVVRSIGAELDPQAAGYAVRAIVGVTVHQPGKKAFIDKLKRAAEVLECHHVAGADSYLMTVVARDLADLERFLASINGYGETRTSIVFSTPIARRGLVPPGTERQASSGGTGRPGGGSISS
jgi:Lrp/AsnC family leucine-responsive transcriptional regulator